MFALDTRHREEQKPLRGPSKDLRGPEHGEQDFYLAAAWSSCVIVNYYQLIQVIAVETWFVVYIRLAFCAKCIFTNLRLPPPARMHNIKQAAEQFVGEREGRDHCIAEIHTAPRMSRWSWSRPMLRPWKLSPASCSRHRAQTPWAGAHWTGVGSADCTL